MIVNYMLKTLKLIIIIINIAFFIGMFWLIYCEVTMNLVKGWREAEVQQEIIRKRWELATDTNRCQKYLKMNHKE